MTLDVLEFLRRFAGHVLPKGFVRIRYWGLLANRNRREKLGLCREKLGAAEPAVDGSGEEPPPDEDEQLRERPPNPTCPHCGKGLLVISAPLPRQAAGHSPQSRAPP